MIALVTLPVLLLSLPPQQEPDSLLVLAKDGRDSALVDHVTRRPDAARGFVRRLLGASGAAGDSATAALATAERLSRAYATAWSDSFYLRRVHSWQSLPPADRAALLAADSVRRAGDKALLDPGFDAAVREFRESLRRFQALGDTWGTARALGSIGQAFRSANELDSAEAYITRALNLAERIRDSFSSAQAMTELANVRDDRGDLAGAETLLVRAGEATERIGDRRGVAMVQGNLGVLFAKQGNLIGARRAFERSVEVARSLSLDDLVSLNLLNLSHVARIEGDYREAEADLREALAVFRGYGDQPYIAATLSDVAEVALLRGDYPGAIAALAEAATILRRIGPGPEMNETTVRVALAWARAHAGDYQGALAELSRADSVTRQVTGGHTSLTSLALVRGDLAVEFNRLADAERHYARADSLAARAANTADRQDALFGKAVVLYRRANYRRAQAALEQLLRTAPAVQTAAEARLLLGQSTWRLGDTTAARRAFRQAIDTLRALGAVVDEAEALAALGDLERESGHASAAESLYQSGLARLGTRSAPAVVWRLHAGLAGALRSRGDMTNAAKELQTAIAGIERTSGGLALEEHRSAFRADKWDVYVALSLVERARGRAEAAFEVSEQLRARQMLDLLARGRVANSGVSGALASREQDLRHRIGALRQDLDSAQRDVSGLRDPSGTDAAGAGGEAKALAQAEDAYRDLLEEMHAASPAYAALVRGEIASASAVRAALAPDEALLEYLTGDSTTMVFAVTADTVVALDLQVPHEALVARVDFARGMLASPAGGAGAGRQAWRPALRRLYQQLVAPVEATGVLAGKRRLLIAPHAELHYLPFAALLVPGPPERFLVDRYVIEYVPSASVWMRLRERPAPSRGGGVLALAPRTAALPGSRAEVEAIGRVYGARAQTLVGRAATEHAFRTLASGHEIVHLATYGVLNKNNPLFSYVELGRAEGEDGRLEVHEVFGLTLDARLVVLSACQTAVAAGTLADVPPGDDWVGLVQGFLYAGAGNVLGTLWPVADVTTARLMERFYRELAAGRPEVEALAVAQRAAAGNAQTAHPFYWAGFTLVRGR